MVRRAGPRVTIWVAGWVALWLAARPVAAQTGVLYFAQITDVHLGVLDHDRVFEQAIEALNAAPFPLACLVVTGDLFADTLAKAEVRAVATSVLARVRIPVHVLAGNHDILEKRAAQDMVLWTNTFGPLAATVDYGGVRFLFVYTEGLFRSSEDRWFDAFGFLERALREAGSRPVLVFHHSAWFPSYYNNALWPSWPPEAAARWVGILRRTGNVKAVIAGHSHRDELHWEGEIPVYVGTPLARFWGRQPMFRIYEFREGRLSYRTWTLTDAPRSGERSSSP